MVYPAYVTKAERKGKTKDELDRIIRWLSGYDHASLEDQIEQEKRFESFFDEAPEMNFNCNLINYAMTPFLET